MHPEAHAGFKDTKRFTVRRRLGAGGMGVVYEAYDGLARQVVALKTLLRADASARYRLKNEFRALADIAHPNLVSLFELFMESDSCFFTMELVEGENFLRYAAEPDGPSQSVTDLAAATTLATATAPRLVEPPSHAAPSSARTAQAPVSRVRMPSRSDRLRLALCQVAEGLCALHDSGKLHRDIKPSNILVTEAHRVVILDFGLITEVVHPGMIDLADFVGTPAYMSPEQAAGGRLTPASDWYSLGVTLYEALTGRLPIQGSHREILANKQEVDPLPPSRLAEGVPQDLEELCMDLLRRQPGERASSKEVLHRLLPQDGQPGRTFHLPRRSVSFVGREVHTAKLWQAFSRSRDGATERVYIHGNSGMGKSTLVRNFLTQLEEKTQVLVLTGNCYERESIPYKALDGVVDHLCRYLVSLPSARVEVLLPRDVAALAKMFPVLQQVKTIAGYPSSMRDAADPQTVRRRAFVALRELLGRISDRVPLVITIDDLHWSDTDSMALLEDLFRPPDAPAMLLLATFRSESIPEVPFLHALLEQTGSNDCHELRLDGFSATEGRSLVRSMLDDAPATDEFVETVMQEARGNPFLIEQFVRWSAEVSDAAARSISVGEMLVARIRQLPEGARPMLETLAVAAHPVPMDVLFRTAGLRENAESLVAFLRSTYFLRSTGKAQTVELYHDRIRESIAALLSPDDVRRIHSLLAEGLVAAGVDDPEVLFEHCIGADQCESALKYAKLAAAKAGAALAFDRAAAFYRRALEVVPPHSSEVERLKGELGGALANAGRPAEAARVYLDAAERAEPARALDLQRRAAEQFLLGGHVDEGMGVIRIVLDRVGMSLAQGPKTALFSLLWHRLQLRLRGLGFTERSELAIPPDELLRIDICWAVAAGLAMVDNIRGADFQTRHLLLSLHAGEPYRVARAFAVEAGFSATSGTLGSRRAERFSCMAAELSERVNQPHAIGLTKLTAGVAAFLVGEWKRALEKCGDAEEILRDQCTGVLWELTSARNFILGSLLYMGDLVEIRRRMPIMVATSNERGNLYAATEIKTRMNFMWLVDNDPDGARGEVSEALRIWSHEGFHRQHYNSMLAQAQIALYVGNGDAAWHTITSKWPVLRSTMLLRIQVLRIEALALKGRSAVAVAASDSRRAQAFLREADYLSRAVEREHVAWSNPLAWLLRAGVEGMRGNADHARHLLSEAEHGFDLANMALHAAVARWRLGELIDSDQGRGLVQTAGEWMSSQGIQNPASMVRMLAPGFLKPSKSPWIDPSEPTLT